VEGTRSRQEPLGREGGRAGYLARPAGTEQMMMMMPQERDLKKWDLNDIDITCSSFFVLAIMPFGLQIL